MYSPSTEATEAANRAERVFLGSCHERYEFRFMAISRVCVTRNAPLS